MADSKVILVTGATGHQGGAVARELLARGHRVRAMTRKPEGDAGRDLSIPRDDLEARSALRQSGEVLAQKGQAVNRPVVRFRRRRGLKQDADRPRHGHGDSLISALREPASSRRCRCLYS